MEDVLDVYRRPYDPKQPLVCMDETSKQLVGEVRTPLPPGPGQPERYDSEYTRNGVSSLFVFYEPLVGHRQLHISDHRTRIDWAHCIKHLIEVQHPAAEKIILVLDQLNTHSPVSLYEAFVPAEAKRLADKLEIHHTPKHGSWLNDAAEWSKDHIAEIELSILARQCLNRRIPDEMTLRQEVSAWQACRNTKAGKVDWRFTTTDARVKLKHLYPSTKE